MAGRKAVISNGLVISVKSGGVRIDRDGLYFRLKIRNGRGQVLLSRRSMILEQLLAELNSDKLAQGMTQAFALREAGQQEVMAALPGFFVDTL